MTSFMHNWASCFSVIATHDENNGESAVSRKDMRSITRRINLHQVAIVMCMRLNMCATEADFHSLRKMSFRVVFRISIMLQHMVKKRNIMTLDEGRAYIILDGDVNLCR